MFSNILHTVSFRLTVLASFVAALASVAVAVAVAASVGVVSVLATVFGADNAALVVWLKP